VPPPPRVAPSGSAGTCRAGPAPFFRHQNRTNLLGNEIIGFGVNPKRIKAFALDPNDPGHTHRIEVELPLLPGATAHRHPPSRVNPNPVGWWCVCVCVWWWWCGGVPQVNPPGSTCRVGLEPFGCHRNRTNLLSKEKIHGGGCNDTERGIETKPTSWQKNATWEYGMLIPEGGRNRIHLLSKGRLHAGGEEERVWLVGGGDPKFTPRE